MASVTPLQRRSVAQEIAGVLRSQILQGELAAGEPLREETLATGFQASRGTIREALRLLEHEGLVQHGVHRGSRVAALDPGDLDDIMAARRLIEPQAAAAAARTRQPLNELAPVAAEMAAAARRGDWARYGTLDVAFHTGIVAAGGSARLTEFFGNTLRELRLHWLRSDRLHAAAGTPPEHAADHATLLRLIGGGQADEARAWMEHHLDEASRLLRSPAE